MKRAAVLAAWLLAGAPAATAGPWIPEPGRSYTSLTFSSLRTTRLATPDGEISRIPEFDLRQISLFHEQGLGGGLSFVVEVPLRHASEIEGFGSAGDVGDVRIGMKAVLLRRSAFVLSARGALQSPTGDETKGLGLLPTGSGAWEALATLAAGWTWAGGRAWGFVEAGGDFRGEGLTDAVAWDSQAGWHATGRLDLVLNVRGLKPVESGARATSQGAAAGLGDRVQYLSWGPWIQVDLAGGWGLSLAADRTDAGRNLAEGTTFRLGVSLNR